MKRTNSPADALNRNKITVSVGDGLPDIELPLDGNFGGGKGEKGEGVPEGGAPLQVVRKTAAGTTTEWATLTPSTVGLSNVDNTADAEKPLSEPQAQALTNKADLVGGKVPESQLPEITPVTDSTVAPLVNGAATGAAIDARINTQVAPQVEQLTANYIAGDRAVADAAAAAVNAAPKIVELEKTTIPKVLSDAKVYTDASKWAKPADAVTADLNSYTAAGIREVTRAGVGNRPVAAAGILEVLPPVGSNVVQRWTTTETPARVYTRRSADMGATWSTWAVMGWRAGGVAGGTDLDTVIAGGFYEIANTNTLNRPTAGIGNLEVFPLGAGVVQQRFTTVDEPAWIFTRKWQANVWSPWVKTPTASDIAALNARIDTLPTNGGGVNAPVRGTIGAWAPTLTTTRWDEYVCVLSRDRLRGWNGQDVAGDLMETRDGGTTWELVKNFGEYFVWVREMDNGELLAATGGVAPNPRSLWVSSGYPSQGGGATWTKVLTAAGPGVTFGTSWGYSQHKNIVLVAEYGPKYNPGNEINEGENARYAYLSLDSGKTFRRIFDLNAWVETTHGAGKAVNVHMHGIAWDPYWDRIWATYGDDVNGTCFSDDLGKTWHAAHWSNQANSLDQNVGIAPLPGRVLFGTDTAPNGVMAFDRTEGKKKGLYTLKQAYTIPGDDGITRTHLCQAIHRIPQEGGTDVWLFGFGAETNPGKSTIAATRDGRNWVTLWQDPIAQAAGKGLRTIAGPTLEGELIVGSDDKRDPSLWSVWRGPVPVY